MARHLGLLYGAGIVAMYLQGPCGDTWPHPYGDSLLPQNGPAKTVALGRGLAGAAAHAADQVERGAYGSRPVVSRWLSPDTGRRMIDAVLVMLQELWHKNTD